MSSHLPDPLIGPQPERLGHFRDHAGFTAYGAAYDAAMADLPPVDEMRSLETDWGTARAFRFGTRGGAPLVLLSGRQAATPMWRANLPTLVEHRDVWSVDSIGEPGASTQTRPLTSVADQAAWVAQAVAQLPAPRVHLMGVSIGGRLVAECVLARQVGIASATLLDPAVTFAPVTPTMIAVSLGSVLPGMPQALRHRLLSRISGGARSSDDVPEGRLIASGMRDFRSFLPQARVPEAQRWSGVVTPLLVILAGDSIVHDVRRAEAAARGVRHAQVEVWEGCSHAINGERPREIARRLHTFIEGLPDE